MKINVTDIRLAFKHSWNFTTYGHSIFRDDALGIQCEKITSKRGSRKTEEGFYIDGYEEEFESLEELVSFWNENKVILKDKPFKGIVR